MLITKVQKKHKNTTGMKFRLTVNEEIKRGCEEESEGSPIPIFPPLYFKIARMLAG